MNLWPFKKKKPPVPRLALAMKANTGEIVRVDYTDKADDYKWAIKVGRLLPLARAPKKDCPACYGRGHRGRNLITGKRILCRCVRG